FHNIENTAALADSLLGIEHGPLGIEAYGKHDKRKQGERRDVANQRDADRQRPPDQLEALATPKALTIDQPTGIQVLDLNLAGDFFQPGGGLLDLDSVHAEVKQFGHG